MKNLPKNTIYILSFYLDALFNYDYIHSCFSQNMDTSKQAKNKD